jgi:protein TonB
MYEAMRQRAPGSSKLAGVASSILITGLAGYALANGVGGDIVKVLERTTIYVVPKKPVEPLPDIDRIPIGDDIDLLFPTSPIPDDIFVPDGDASIKAERRTPDNTEDEAAIAPVTPPVRKVPRLISKEKPPYPAPDIRGRNEGDTGVEVCVAANGRVSSVQLATSSGHPRLDAAALKWVRSARFTPGSVGGAPQSMCGHTVVYEWRLEDVTR